MGKHEGKSPLGRHGVDGSLMLEMALRKQDGIAWTGLIWHMMDASYGLLRTR